MSKKSRRRNKRLALLLTLAGGAALAGRGKKKFGTDAGFLKSGAAGGASLSSPPILGTDHIKAPIRKDVPDVAVDKKVIIGSGEVPIGRMRGAGTDEQAIENQKIRAAYAQKGRGINPFEQTAAAGAAYVPIIPRVMKRGVNYRMKAGGRIGAKHGGRVTGIAKRGFGRALGRGEK